MLRMLKTGAAAALVVALALSQGTLTAQQAKDETKKVEAKTPPAPPPGGITDEQLGDMLKKLGYKTTQDERNGSNVFTMEFPRDGFNHVVAVFLSADRKNVVLGSSLLKLPNGEKLRADILEKILQTNEQVGPVHFACGADRTLLLVRIFSNRNVTTSRLRREIDNVTTIVKQTYSLWNPERYPAPETK